MAAAEVAANAPFAESDPQSETEPFAASATKVAGDSANDSIAEQSPTEPSATETDSYIQPAAQDQSGTESDLERQFMDLYGEPAVEVSMETTPTGPNISATQRITTVHAINSTSPAAADAGGQARKSKPVSRPDSIEDQINTSLTQSLMALDPAEIERMQEPEEEQEQPKTGFFSRFRRS